MYVYFAQCELEDLRRIVGGFTYYTWSFSQPDHTQSFISKSTAWVPWAMSPHNNQEAKEAQCTFDELPKHIQEDIVLWFLLQN